MDRRVLDLIATAVGCCEERSGQRLGHQKAEVVRVLACLRRFLRKGTPWLSLRASAGEVSGSTLRRHLAHWARRGVLARVHALLVAMLRGNPRETCAGSTSVPHPGIMLGSDDCET